MGKWIYFQPLRILREHQHQTTCAQGFWPALLCAAHRTRVLSPHCIFWVSLRLWWWAEFWTGLLYPLYVSSHSM